MTASIGSPHGSAPAGGRREWWQSSFTARIALAGAFVAILLGTVSTTEDWAHATASVVGFLAAITLIVASAVGWERVVNGAESAGLVVPPETHR